MALLWVILTLTSSGGAQSWISQGCDKPDFSEFHHHVQSVHPDTITIATGESYTITCMAGFDLSEVGPMVCSGEELSPPSTCDLAKCNKPEITHMLSYEPNKERIDHGQMYTISCQQGHYLSDSSPIACTLGALTPTVSCIAGIPNEAKGKRLTPTSGVISSISNPSSIAAAYDGRLGTIIRSSGGSDLAHHSINLTFTGGPYLFSSVTLVFYRYDEWCVTNPVGCTDSWHSLEGLQISVGSLTQGDSSLVDCGTVGSYTVTDVTHTGVPEPVYQHLDCSSEVNGDWMVIKQTLGNTVLQFSEIYVFESAQCTGLPWDDLTTALPMPVQTGTVVSVECGGGMQSAGAETVTCHVGLAFYWGNDDGPPSCQKIAVKPGNLYVTDIQLHIEIIRI